MTSGRRRRPKTSGALRDGARAGDAEGGAVQCVLVCAGLEQQEEHELELVDVRVLDMVATATTGRPRRAMATSRAREGGGRGQIGGGVLTQGQRKQIGRRGSRTTATARGRR